MRLLGQFVEHVRVVASEVVNVLGQYAGDPLGSGDLGVRSGRKEAALLRERRRNKGLGRRFENPLLAGFDAGDNGEGYICRMCFSLWVLWSTS